MDVTDEHPRPSHKTRKAGPPVRGVWTVSGKTFEGSAGGIFVINAGEVTASRRSAIHHSYNSTFTSAPASSKRTYRAMRTDEITVSGRAGWLPRPFAFSAKAGDSTLAHSAATSDGSPSVPACAPSTATQSLPPSYSQKHRTFPHESPADQWFDETQFESYRALGEFIGIAADRRNPEGD
jgi:hypothetical protein